MQKKDEDILRERGKHTEVHCTCPHRREKAKLKDEKEMNPSDSLQRTRERAT